MKHVLHTTSPFSLLIHVNYVHESISQTFPRYSHFTIQYSNPTTTTSEYPLTHVQYVAPQQGAVTDQLSAAGRLRHCGTIPDTSRWVSVFLLHHTDIYPVFAYFTLILPYMCLVSSYQRTGSPRLVVCITIKCVFPCFSKNIAVISHHSTSQNLCQKFCCLFRCRCRSVR